MNARQPRIACILAVVSGAASFPDTALPQASAWTIDPATLQTFGPSYEIAPFDYRYSYLRLLPNGGVATARLERYEVTIYDAAGQAEREFSAWPGNQLGRVTGISAPSTDTILVYDVPASGTLRRTRFLRD